MTAAQKLLRELIALPSVNPAFLPAKHRWAGEQKVSEFLACAAGRAGLDIDFQRVASGRSNLLVKFTPHGEVRRRILLAPHLDTVNGTEEQFSPKTSHGRIYGRGACDTKGSVAAMFTALVEVAKRGVSPPGTEIIFAGLVDEEHAQAGSRVLARSGLTADLAIIGEPTQCRLFTAHKGSIWLEIETQGRAAHGARPDEGVNAVHLMAKVIDYLESDYPARLKKRRHPLLGFPTSSVGTICGGTQANIVPDRCVVTVDRRTLPGEVEESVVAELQSWLETKRLRARVSSCKGVECLPLETDAESKVVKLFLKTLKQRRPLGATYFCDAAILSKGGIPSVVFGPGDIAQAHTSDEWISLDSLENATQALIRFLRSAAEA